MIKEIKTHNSY